MRHPWRSILESLVVTAMIIVIIETVSEYVYFVPIRSPIYFIPIIYFTFARGWQSGVASAVLALTYAIIDQLVRFGDDQLIAFRILIFLVTITVTTLMVARLRQQYDTSLAAQQHAAEQYRLLFEHNPHPMWIYDRETLRLMAVNTAAVQIYGYSHDQFLQLRVVDLYLPEDHADLVRQIRELPGPYRQPGVWTQRTRDGRLIEVEVTTHDIDFQGRSARLALIIDVTVRRRAEADLRMIRLAVERTSDAIGISDETGRAIYHNPAYRALLGYTPDEVNARGGPEITYADANTAREVYETLITRGTWHRDVALRSAAGHILIADLRADRILDEQGTQAGLIGVFSDVTERRRAERALHELEQRLIQHVENSPLAVIEWNADLQVRRWSIRATQIFGWDETAVVGRRLDEWPASAPDNQVAIHAMLQPLLTSQPHRNVSVILVHNQRGEQLYCEWYNSALFDDEGNFVSILSLVHDMTDRQRLQEQFLQSQKMEIVGRLAGGIAHDFNNLLTVILSYSELAHEMAEPESSIADDLAEVRRAAERAADLTSRLLTFARKQIIAPRPLDLNLLLLDLDRLLRRLIGEDIELILLMYTDTANVLADAGQIEQAVINLVVNARDAMPQGGRLVIETSLIELHAEYREASLAVAPGWYVQLAVSDTGTGMDEATRSRIFEPFFTTKVSGKGTGLGLATCYGIVRQHNGHITAYSEPGEGTTFRIYLPLYQPDTAEPLPIATMATLPRGSETILLVEDDAQLRGLALRILRDQGYRVIEAHDGREALRIAHEATHPIDLLLTDIILPHVSGTELAFQLQSVHPAMRVLYTSGYTEYTALHNGRIDAGMAFVAKPFTPMVLTAMVRRVLDE